MSAAISFIGGSNNNKEGLVGTVALNAGDLKLRASTIAPTFVAGPAFEDLSLAFSVEKPGSFIIDYDVPNKVIKLKIPPFSFTFLATKQFIKFPFFLSQN